MTVSLRDYPGSHFNMCNGANGSCFTPWCSCPCHQWTGPMEPAEPGPAVVGGASPATPITEVSSEARRKAIAAIGRRMTWPSLHWRDLGHTDAHAAIVDLLIDEGWGPVSGAVRPTREALAEAIWPVLFNASNYPGKASMAILGQNIGPLRDKIVAALLAAGHLWAEQPAEDAADPVRTVLAHSSLGTGLTLTPKEVDGLTLWIKAHSAVSSVPVVDREALAQAYRTAWDEAPTTVESNWAEYFADAVIGSGLFVDRAVVEAEQREKDAQIAHDWVWDPDDNGSAAEVAAAIRQGDAS